MAFVLVQHLAPDHKSLLSQLIGRYTRMQVLEVQDAMVVQANCVYIIAPNYDMSLRQGVLHLLEPAAPRAQLLAYVAHAFGKLAVADKLAMAQTEGALHKIFALLRAQTGHDFSQYKPSTICRRIERRMAVHQVGDLETYVQYLQKTPSEIDALFGDLLIGVTHFFRDAEAFAALKAHITPQLFASKSANKANQHSLRVWSAGCSTGEEAYSLAILLFECISARYAAAGAARSQHQRPPVAATGLFRAAPNPAGPAPGHRAGPAGAGSARDQRAGRYGADIAAD